MSADRFLATELDIFVYWITAREGVRRAKESGQPKPWTEDPLLRDFRWCNVRRLDDRVSRWLFDYWYDPSGYHANHVRDAILARLINWPDTLAEIRAVPLAEARRKLALRAGRGEKVFTGAYVIPGVPGFNKVDSVFNLVEGVNAFAVIGPASMRGAWLALTQVDGLGSFLAGQIVADLAHLTAGACWSDSETWAPVGPGSARGINRLLGRPKDKGVSQSEFETLLRVLSAEVRPRISDIWSDRQLQAMDLQNCLCEFDKYRRLTLGEGKVRARYAGSADAPPSPQTSLI